VSRPAESSATGALTPTRGICHLNVVPQQKPNGQPRIVLVGKRPERVERRDDDQAGDRALTRQLGGWAAPRLRPTATAQSGARVTTT
jgi:hypothetical protein